MKKFVIPVVCFAGITIIAAIITAFVRRNSTDI